MKKERTTREKRTPTTPLPITIPISTPTHQMAPVRVLRVVFMVFGR